MLAGELLSSKLSELLNFITHFLLSQGEHKYQYGH